MPFTSREDALDAVRTLISYIGDDPSRDGLRDTPERVLRAWEQDWGQGYRYEPATAFLRTFSSDERYNQMVVVRDLSMFSHCEHHLTPFYGSVHIAYVPRAIGLLGLSKLARIVDMFARRLQMQERLTSQIATCLQMHLSEHVGVMIEATHLCMVSRGVQQPRSTTITTALRGDFLNDGPTRAEFLASVRTENKYHR